jgi:hypothetical protein
MRFDPNPGYPLDIEGVIYRVVAHPAAPKMAYGQQGRTATVYQLVTGTERRALKVFTASFRTEMTVSVAEKLKAFAELPGMQICRRVVLNPKQNSALLRDHPDLKYAVLMPWVDGMTWFDLIQSQQVLSFAQSSQIARSLVSALVEMEQHDVAHCDISGANVIIHSIEPTASTEQLIGFVDVEQLFGPGLTPPESMPGGSPGYAHKTAPDGLWSKEADRFAGAILLAEMLGWCDPAMSEAAWGESYLQPEEIHQDCERYRLLLKALREHWGNEAASLFERAWRSERLANCAPFSEWAAALQMGPAKAAPAPAEAEGPTRSASPITPEIAPALIGTARKLEAEGNLTGALLVYQQVSEELPPDHPLRNEVAQLIQSLDQKMQKAPEPSKPPPAPPEPLIIRTADQLQERHPLTRQQLLTVLIGVPILGAILVGLLVSQGANLATLNYFALTSLIGPAIYVALRRRWLTALIFVPTIFIGALPSYRADIDRLAVAVVLGGVVLEALVLLSRVVVKEPARQRPLEIAWMAVTGLVCTLVIYLVRFEFGSGDYGYGQRYYTQPLFYLVNLGLGAVGWFVGDFLHTALVQLRERTQEA